MNFRQVLRTGIATAGLSVAIGAFGAHALRSTLEANDRTETFELAVRYQFYHALALLFLGMWLRSNASTLLNWTGLLWLGGILLFSGSLYLLSITNNKTYAMVTPVGGLLFLAGWICLVIDIARSK